MLKPMRRRIFAFGLVATLVSTSALAQGQASAPANGGNSQAGEFILKLAERAVTGLTKPGVTAEERDQRFRDLFHEGFDVPAIARFALGRYWRTANEDERREYLKLFEDLIVQTYAHRFTSYSGERLRVVTTRTASDGEHVARKAANAMSRFTSQAYQRSQRAVHGGGPRYTSPEDPPRSPHPSDQRF